MSDILFGRYFTLFEVLVDFLLVLLVYGAVYLVVRRLRHGRSKGDEKRQTEGQPTYDGPASPGVIRRSAEFCSP